MVVWNEAFKKRILPMPELNLIKNHYLDLNLPMNIGNYFKKKEINSTNKIKIIKLNKSLFKNLIIKIVCIKYCNQTIISLIQLVRQLILPQAL